MIATTFDDQAVVILQAPPNWANQVSSSHELLVDATAGLSNREARRPHSASLRTSLSYTALLHDQELRRLVGALGSVANKPVLLPFWPAARTWSARATAPIQGGLKLVWTADWSTWEVYTTVEPSWPAAGDNWAPLLWGFLGERGTLAGARWYNALLADLAISFTEDGPAAYALQPAAGTVVAGPLPPAGYATAPRLLPIQPNFERLQDAIALRLERKGVGFRRAQPAEFYPQSVARIQELGYQLSSDASAAALLAFFRDYAGRGASFWAPSWVAAAVLDSAVAAADTVLQVADTLTVSVGAYLGLLNGSTVIGRRVTAVTADTLTVNAAVGADLPKSALISPLLLVRMERPRLDLDWTHSHLADASLRVRELPPEYAPAADETRGTTLGQLPERCYLYDFTRDHGGALLHDRYTSYESDVTYGGHTWVSADVDHGTIQQGLALDANRVDLVSRVFSGNPLVAIAALRSEVSVRLAIMSADVAAAVATNVQILATGEVDKSRLRGESIAGQLTPGGRLLNQQAPRFEVGPPCNHGLYSVACGLAKSAWVHTAAVNGAPTAAFPFTLAIDGLARTTGPTPTYFADWFAHGWVEIGTAGTAGWQRRWILTSTNPVSGALVLTLHRAFDPLPADNAAVKLYPGCDLTAESCKAYHASTNPKGKFDNYAAFGGHPYVPAGNPALVKLSKNLGGGKK